MKDRFAEQFPHRLERGRIVLPETPRYPAHDQATPIHQVKRILGGRVLLVQHTDLLIRRDIHGTAA